MQDSTAVVSSIENAICDVSMPTWSVMRDSIPPQLANIKAQHVERGEGTRANEIWRIETLNAIRGFFEDGFSQMKAGEYYQAWCNLERCEINISALRRNYDVGNISIVIWIEEFVAKFQDLYPYRIFSSIEMIHRKQECSICGTILTPRSLCGHQPGIVYFGEICSVTITEAQIIGVGIVENPRNKYAVLTPSDFEYDYSLVEYVVGCLHTPYCEWELIQEPDQAPTEFSEVARNSPCPCGSGKKYKKCCLHKKRMMYWVKLSQPPPAGVPKIKRL